MEAPSLKDFSIYFDRHAHSWAWKARGGTIVSGYSSKARASFGARLEAYRRAYLQQKGK